MLLAFGQRHTKTLFIEDFYFTRFCHFILYAYTGLHIFLEARAKWFFGDDEVLLFVIETWMKKAFCDTAVIREYDESVGVLVETSNREDTRNVDLMFDVGFAFSCRVAAYLNECAGTTRSS